MFGIKKRFKEKIIIKANKKTFFSLKKKKIRSSEFLKTFLKKKNNGMIYSL